MSTIRIWTVAATSPFKAFRNFVMCLQRGHEAAIKRVRNEDALHNAIRMKNPDLNHHENWEAGSAYPQSEAQLAARCYFNDVERDLTYNWDTVFSQEEHQWVLCTQKAPVAPSVAPETGYPVLGAEADEKEGIYCRDYA